MNLDGADVFVPDGVDPMAAVERTTHLAVGAHQDDVPIMAYHGIVECFGREDRWFTAVTVTDGAGSPRSGPYADHSDEDMQGVRAAEERKAAVVGEYAAAIQLGHSSGAAKSPDASDIVDRLARILDRARPGVVYTHNLADKHDTHVAVAIRTLEALRTLPPERRPEAVYGCEVWRDLDWLTDADKVRFDVSARQNIATALLGIYDSQVGGGKRYDLATMGRRLAHATFAESHAVDDAPAVVLGMDLTSLVTESMLDIGEYVVAHIDRMKDEITERIDRLSAGSDRSDVPPAVHREEGKQ